MFRPDNRPPEDPRNGLLVVFQRGELVSDMRSRQACLIPG